MSECRSVRNAGIRIQEAGNARMECSESGSVVGLCHEKNRVMEVVLLSALCDSTSTRVPFLSSGLR